MKIRDFQLCIRDWMKRCFSPATVSNPRERAFRFLEEAVELFQSMDCTKEEAQSLVDYVFGRPKGETEQEIGGVSVTLAALCDAADIDWQRAARDELERINSPEVLAKIRAKRAARVVPGDYKGEPEPKVTCSRCGGKGQWLQSANLHESEGWVPCGGCAGTGLRNAQ